MLQAFFRDTRLEQLESLSDEVSEGWFYAAIVKNRRTPETYVCCGRAPDRMSVGARVGWFGRVQGLATPSGELLREEFSWTFLKSKSKEAILELLRGLRDSSELDIRTRINASIGGLGKASSRRPGLKRATHVVRANYLAAKPRATTKSEKASARAFSRSIPTVSKKSTVATLLKQVSNVELALTMCKDELKRLKILIREVV